MKSRVIRAFAGAIVAVIMIEIGWHPFHVFAGVTIMGTVSELVDSLKKKRKFDPWNAVALSISAAIIGIIAPPQM